MYLDDVSVGMQIDIPEVVIDKAKMIEFAKIYDPIPIHCDEEYAKHTRFGKLIAPGVMTFMSVWAKFMEHDIFAEELIAGKSTKIEWLKPVFAEDVLKGTARISNIARRNPYNGIAEMTIDIYNQHGELVMINVTESVVKYKSVQ